MHELLTKWSNVNIKGPTMGGEVFWDNLAQHSIGIILALIENIKRLNYHLYSPEETVQRARSKIGERQYNLVFNNCEHFAVWCKTGLSESRQINELIRMITRCDDEFLRQIPYLA